MTGRLLKTAAVNAGAHGEARVAATGREYLPGNGIKHVRLKQYMSIQG